MFKDICVRLCFDTKGLVIQTTTQNVISQTDANIVHSLKAFILLVRRGSTELVTVE